MHRIGAVEILALTLLLLSPPTEARAGKELTEAKRLLRTGDAADRQKAIEVLVRLDSRSSIQPLEDAITRSVKDMEGLDKELEALDEELVSALSLLYMALSWGDARMAELAERRLHEVQGRQSGLQNRLAAHLDVMNQAGRALGRFRDPKALAKVQAGARSESHPYVRQMYIMALGASGSSKNVPTLLALLKSSDDRVRSVAVRALRRHLCVEGVAEAVRARADDKSWPVRLGVYGTLARLPFEVAVPLLVEAVQKEEGALADAIDAYLESLTGRSFPGMPPMWAAWWKEHAEAVESGTYVARDVDAARPESGHTRASYFRIPIDSKNVLFVLDHSGSMREEMHLPDGSLNELLAELKLEKTRLGYAQGELVRAIRSLEPGTLFNIVVYGDKAERFSRKPRKVSRSTVRSATTWVRKRKTGYLTNIWDALRLAYGDHLSRRARSVRLGELPDTIVFLTDGNPTTGRFRDGVALGELVRMWNFAVDAVVHCVGMGDDHDKDLLVAISEASGGYYVDISRGLPSLERQRRGIPATEQFPHSKVLLEQLWARMEIGDMDAQLEALKALEGLGTWAKPVLPHLAEALDGYDRDVLPAAVRTMVNISAVGALGYLAPLLRGEDEERIVVILDVLADKGSEACGALDDFLRLLRHEQPRIRCRAARAIGAMGSAARRARKALKAALEDEDEEVVEAAKQALRQLWHG